MKTIRFIACLFLVMAFVVPASAQRSRKQKKQEQQYEQQYEQQSQQYQQQYPPQQYQQQYPPQQGQQYPPQQYQQYPPQQYQQYPPQQGQQYPPQQYQQYPPQQYQQYPPQQYQQYPPQQYQQYPPQQYQQYPPQQYPPQPMTPEDILRMELMKLAQENPCEYQSMQWTDNDIRAYGVGTGFDKEAARDAARINAEGELNRILNLWASDFSNRTNIGVQKNGVNHQERVNQSDQVRFSEGDLRGVKILLVKYKELDNGVQCDMCVTMDAEAATNALLSQMDVQNAIQNAQDFRAEAHKAREEIRLMRTGTNAEMQKRQAEQNMQMQQQNQQFQQNQQSIQQQQNYNLQKDQQYYDYKLQENQQNNMYNQQEQYQKKEGVQYNQYNQYNY